MTIKNALTIDVEDYFQVSAFEKVIDRNTWEDQEHRVEANMAKILQMLADNNIRATFFTLGWLADRYPSMVESIVAEGHELASHGYGHQRVWDLEPEQFREDVDRTKKLLEDVGGVSIIGYRAPSYSINRRNLWAIDILAQTGHKYSSSIYPGSHDHYGFPGAPRFVFRESKSGLIEIPITTCKIMNRLVPAAGGGFFRLYPYLLSRQLIRSVNRESGDATVFYFHPWEVDPGQPRQPNVPVKTRFRHYLNLRKMSDRLERLLQDFNWGRMDEIFIERDNIPSIALT